MTEHGAVDPHVAQMIDSGQLVLAEDVDPTQIRHIVFDHPARAAESAGYATTPACLLEPEYVRALAETGGVHAHNGRVLASGVITSALAPPPLYVHCDRDCARCDAVFHEDTATP